MRGTKRWKEDDFSTSFHHVNQRNGIGNLIPTEKGSASMEAPELNPALVAAQISDEIDTFKACKLVSVENHNAAAGIIKPYTIS